MVGDPALGTDGDAQVVLGDEKVPGHRPRRPAPGQIREPPQRPVAGPAPVDALEALVEAALGAVGVLADEPPDADRQGDDEGANDVDHVPPAVAVGPHRRSFTRWAQRRRVAAGHVHDGPDAGLDSGEHPHVGVAEDSEIRSSTGLARARGRRSHAAGWPGCSVVAPGLSGHPCLHAVTRLVAISCEGSAEIGRSGWVSLRQTELMARADHLRNCESFQRGGRRRGMPAACLPHGRTDGFPGYATRPGYAHAPTLAGVPSQACSRASQP